MGFELVYCWKCTRRLTEGDFKDGKALRVGIHTSCRKCADELLSQLPPDQRESILSRTDASDPPTRVTASRVAKPATPRGLKAAPRPPARPPRPGLPIPAIGIVVAACAVAAVLLMAGARKTHVETFGKQAETPEAAPGRSDGTPDSGPVVATTTPPIGAGSGFFVEPKRVTEAKEALQKAVDHQEAKPEDLAETVRLFEQAIWTCEKTPYEEEAKRGHAAAVVRLETTTVPALAALNEKLKPLMDREAYQEALDLLESSRRTESHASWGGTIDRKIKEIHDAAEGKYNRLRSKAISARKQRDEAEVERIRMVVRAWGIPRYIESLERLLTETPS